LEAVQISPTKPKKPCGTSVFRGSAPGCFGNLVQTRDIVSDTH